MYVKLKNQTIEKYPYSINDLIKDNPNTSFPQNPTDALLSEWGVFSVSLVEIPIVDHTKNVTEGSPVQENGKWKQSWVVTNATTEQIQQRTNDKALAVRSERDKLISQSDWTQLNDSPISGTKQTEWGNYRQALRDIPQQTGFPWNVNWPNKP